MAEAGARYYEVLGLRQDASADEIKPAFKRLATRYRSYSNSPRAKRRLKEIAAAYEVLSDPDKRWAYDRVLSRYEEVVAKLGDESSGGIIGWWSRLVGGIRALIQVARIEEEIDRDMREFKNRLKEDVGPALKGYWGSQLALQESLARTAGSLEDLLEIVDRRSERIYLFPQDPAERRQLAEFLRAMATLLTELGDLIDGLVALFRTLADMGGTPAYRFAGDFVEISGRPGLTELGEGVSHLMKRLSNIDADDVAGHLAALEPRQKERLLKLAERCLLNTRGSRASLEQLSDQLEALVVTARGIEGEHRDV